MQSDSDLTYIPLILVLLVGVFAVLACYFFIGAVVGTIVLLVAIVLAIVGAVRFIRRNETG